MDIRSATPVRQVIVLGLLFVATFIVFSFYFLSQPAIPDGDSYYHLAIARQFNQHGIIHDLPWARFSVMRDGFGDNQFLFHLILAPLTAAGDPLETGRLALAFFNALLIAVLAWLGMRAAGWWGLLVPAFVYLGSYPFTDRVSRLRPELLAVTLMLLIVWFAARRRYLFLAIVCALFALEYTAWHVVVMLSVLFAIADRIAEARFEWKSPLAVLGGTVAGLLVHPHFPHQLVVWWYQNVLHFLHESGLDVSTENHPPALRDTLLFNLPIGLASIIFLLCTRAASDGDEESERPARYLLIAAAIFAILYLKMSRMIVWLVPLTVLALILRRRVVVHRRALIAGLAITLAAGALQTVIIFRQGTGALHSAEANAAALGRTIPDGAKVAADWPDGTELMFFAPQGRYLNVLDPTFMALRYPREYGISQRIWSGQAVDVPASIRALDSDFIMFLPTQQHQLLMARMARDPRFTPLYTTGAIMARLNHEAMPAFLRDWRVAPADKTTPVDRWPFYSWPGNERVKEVEAYVDLSGPGEPCRTAAIELTVANGTIEIAPAGPAEVRLDGWLVGETKTSPGAILGKGLIVPIRLTAGKHWMTVTTCGSGDRRGFYALVRNL